MSNLKAVQSDDVLVYDAEKDPVRGEFVHVDFYALDVDKPITADVNIVFEGVAPAVKELGGVLVKVLHKLEIEALPKDFPHEIKIDVSKLANIGDRITVKDLALGKSVKVKVRGRPGHSFGQTAYGRKSGRNAKSHRRH